MKKWEPLFEGSICKIPLPNNGYALIDAWDYERVKVYKWSQNGHGYVHAWDGKSKKVIKLSRLIMNYPENQDVDHENHDKLDNRKENLRPCSRSQNEMNLTGRKNRLGIKGVHEHKDGGFIAQIQVDHKKVYLGSFHDVTDAITARKEAEIEYHGEFRYKGEQI